MAPAVAAHLKRHWYSSGTVPVAVTVNRTLLPAKFAWLSGCWVITGGLPMLRIAAPLVTPETTLLTATE